MKDQIKVTVQDRTGYIQLNRPEKRNALDASMVRDLQQALDELEKQEEVKVVVLHAAGEVFCAGADLEYIRQMQHFTRVENLKDSHSLKDLFYRLYSFPKVIIAQVQGHALAGGCGLATVCDFVFTVPDAEFGYTEAKIGFVPAIVLVFLQRKIGDGRARELLLSGNLITAEQALEYGVVNELVEAEDLEKAVGDFAERLIHQNSAASMKVIKTMLADIQGMSFLEALDHAASINAKARESEDCKKGIAAFLNKEKIDW